MPRPLQLDPAALFTPARPLPARREAAVRTKTSGGGGELRRGQRFRRKRQGKTPKSSALAGETNSGLAQRHERSSLVGMSMAIDQIVEEIRSLPHDVVADLVDRVLLESQGGQERAIARDWSTTVHHRIEEIRSGAVAGIPGEVTAAKIRGIVGR